jgi:hypothetical protein
MSVLTLGRCTQPWESPSTNVTCTMIKGLRRIPINTIHSRSHDSTLHERHPSRYKHMGKQHGHATSSCVASELSRLRRVQRAMPGRCALLAILSAPPVRNAADGGIAIAPPAGGSNAPPSVLWRGKAYSEDAAAEGRGLQPQRCTSAGVAGRCLQWRLWSDLRCSDSGFVSSAAPDWVGMPLRRPAPMGGGLQRSGRARAQVV